MEGSPKVVAVAGKGGSGKTTLSALLVRALVDRGRTPVLAVDADPNSNLGEALGVEVRKTLGEAVEELHGERATAPAGMGQGSLLELRFAEILEERKGFDLLAMGRGEGPGCYCSVNNALRALVEKLTRSYRVVVIDNEAGLEHLSREGHCSPVAGAPHGGRAACAGTGVCSSACDGTDPLTCAFPDETLACSERSCEDGVATPGGSCDGPGSCLAPDSVPCEPYACGAPHFLSACSTDEDCADGHACSGAECVPLGADADAGDAGDEPADGGCGCSSGGSTPASGGSALLLLALALVGDSVRRPRRR